MRLIWISVAVILLDQFTKFILHLSNLTDSIRFVKGGLALVVLQNSGISVQQINEAMVNSTSWMLISGLIALPLLISRWNNLFHFTTIRTVLGLQLAAGGIISYSFDYFLRGDIQSSIELRLYEVFTLKAGIADLALLSGFLLLVYALISGATRISSKVTLLHTTPTKLDLSPLPRGVDNIHIDVYLSPEFCRHTTTVVHHLANRVIDELKQKKAPQPLSAKLFTQLTKSFLTLHQSAISKAKASGEPQRVDLLYISILKFIHGEVTQCVATRVRQTKDAIQGHQKRGIGNNDESRFIEELFRRQDQIIATVNQMILDGMVGKELPNLGKGIRGFLGDDRSFALDVMRSPLVISNAPEVEQVQFKHYLLFGQGKYSEFSFLQIIRVIDEVLRNYLDPIANRMDENVTSESHSREFDSGNTTAETLYRPSVLMHPTNTVILFGQQWTRDKIAKINRIKQWRKYRTFRAHLRFQKRLTERVQISLDKAGMTRWIVAAYEARSLLIKINSDIIPSTLISLLIECESKKELRQRLELICRGINSPPNHTEVEQRWEAMRKQGDTLLQHHLCTFIGDLSRYRRDLLLFFKYSKASTQIELQRDSKLIHTSRANFTLYEFLLPTEKSDKPTAIRSHIIIKADLRGSTEVTDRLNQLALNPATHFDRNFFSPINDVINDFGAEKVFIEGDAIILILNDYAGAHQEHLIASRACALAASILQIVAKQNKELLCYGLPKLELGIGIAYSHESPRFLFDGDHKITISPAINRADRLSACTWSVRNWRERQQAPTTQVEIYQPSERALGHGEKAQKEMVYNLDGILIEPAIFELLQKELSPKRIVNKLPDKQDSILFAIKVPGAGGESSSLIIRKAPVKIYDPKFHFDECPPVDGRYFYEVIHDRAILNTLRKRPTSDMVTAGASLR